MNTRGLPVAGAPSATHEGIHTRQHQFQPSHKQRQYTGTVCDSAIRRSAQNTAPRYLNIAQRVQTGAIEPEAAAVVVHRSRNHNVLAMRELGSAPPRPAFLMPVGSFTRKYAWSLYGREFPELQDEEKQDVSLLVLPLNL
jgi:hypothetical protein